MSKLELFFLTVIFSAIQLPIFWIVDMFKFPIEIKMFFVNTTGFIGGMVVGYLMKKP